MKMKKLCIQKFKNRKKFYLKNLLNNRLREFNFTKNTVKIIKKIFFILLKKNGIMIIK